MSYQVHQLWSTVGKVRNTNSLPIRYELDPINKTTYASISKIHSHPETKFNFHFSFTLYPALSLALRCRRAPNPGPQAWLTPPLQHCQWQAQDLQTFKQFKCNVSPVPKKFLTFFCLLFEVIAAHQCCQRLFKL